MSEKNQVEVRTVCFRPKWLWVRVQLQSLINFLLANADLLKMSAFYLF